MGSETKGEWGISTAGATRSLLWVVFLFSAFAAAMNFGRESESFSGRDLVGPTFAVCAVVSLAGLTVAHGRSG